MFADTLTVTINSVAKVLVRINQDAYSSEYLLKGTLDCFRLRLRNTSYVDKKRSGLKVNRHTVELTQEVYPVSPAVNSLVRKVYTVFENDDNSVPADDAKFVTGLLAFQTEANTLKLINWES